MTDLADLSTVSGDPLDESTIRGILAQIDLDVVNLLRDGKLAAARYRTDGRTMDRRSALDAMLAARRHYEALLAQLPAIEQSHGEVATDDA